MESKGDDPGIGTFVLIYWNHFLEPGLILFHMRDRVKEEEHSKLLLQAKVREMEATSLREEIRTGK